MKKQYRGLIIVLALLLVFTYSVSPDTAFAEGQVVASGTCGENMTWKLNNVGTLSILGSGEMYDYDYASGYRPPWSSSSAQIKTIVISEGVTGIGDNAFNSCYNLTDITIPEGIKRIGNRVFWNCSSLTCIIVPNSVISVGDYAFQGCGNMTNITISGGLTSIGDNAFYGCHSLTGLIIPDGVTSIGDYAFHDCMNLTSVTIPGSVLYFGQNIFDFIFHTVVVYTTPDAYIALNPPDNCTIRYLCNDVTADTNRLGFATDSIVMKTGRVLNLSDYLVSNYSLDECNVTLSNENDFVYDDGKIANLGVGECDVTVTKDDLTATVKIIAQEEDPMAISGISLHDTSLDLAKGEVIINTATLSPINADVSDIAWSSSDESVATVNNGLITATGQGTATVAAYSISDSSIKAECQVTVTTPLYDIIPLETPMVMELGSSRKVPFYRYMYGSTDLITFASEDPAVAAIDENGRVTANHTGTTTITISSGNISKDVTVKVIKSLKGISLDKTSATLYNGETLQLNVIFDPEDTMETDVIWSSSKESVATVDENGLVTAHGQGMVDITATAGKYSATCNVVCPRVALTGIDRPDTLEIEYGTDQSLEVSFVPANTTDDVTAAWISRDESIVTVNDDGIITPQGIGTTTVVAMVGDFAASTTVTVVKGKPSYSVPENLQATCEQTLSEITLPNGFTWTDENETVGSAGEKEFTVVFTPADQEHYITISNIPVIVTVEHYYSEEWMSDDTHHWHQCACGEKTTLEGHTWNDGEVVTAPTCVAGGETLYTCTRCGATEIREPEPNGHTWADEYTIDQEPTCTTDGSKSKHCQFCDQRTEVTVIPALGHDWDTENVVFTWSDDLSEAEATFTCKRDHTHVETLKAAVTSETAAGIITYTATVVFEDATYTDTKTVDTHDIIRLFGSNRYATAIAAADHLKEKKGIETFDTIVIASGDGFPDALSASYLAYKKDGPILLYGKTVIGMVTDYVNDNLSPGGTVYIVGGEGVIPPEVEKLINGKVVRLAGANRYATNIAVLNEAGVEGEALLVASGKGFADALSASAAKRPIFLVGNSLDKSQKDYLDKKASSMSGEIYIIGGQGAVSYDVEGALEGYGTVKRLSGSDRYKTSMAVADEFFKGNVGTVVIANGNNFPDGLSGGPIAVTYDAPLILVVDKISGHAEEYFKAKDAYRLIIMGGTGVIADETAERIFGGTE